MISKKERNNPSTPGIHEESTLQIEGVSSVHMCWFRAPTRHCRMWSHSITFIFANYFWCLRVTVVSCPVPVMLHSPELDSSPFMCHWLYTAFIFVLPQMIKFTWLNCICCLYVRLCILNVTISNIPKNAG